MEDLLAEYNAPFNDYKTPFHRFSAVNVKTDQEIVEHFVTHAYEYNLMFRFGSITTDHPDGQRPPHTNSRFKVIVSNNAVHFNLSGIDAPAGRSSEFAQVFTLMYEFIIVIVKLLFLLCVYINRPDSGQKSQQPQNLPQFIPPYEREDVMDVQICRRIEQVRQRMPKLTDEVVG